MAYGKVIVPLKAITKKKEKADKKLTWTLKFIKLFSGSKMRLTEDILLWYTAISNAVLLDFINKATRAAIFKLSPGFHSAQHRDTRRETRERFISRQIIRQNSSSDLYLDGLSVWRMIRLDGWSVSSINRAILKTQHCFSIHGQGKEVQWSLALEWAQWPILFLHNFGVQFIPFKWRKLKENYLKGKKDNLKVCMKPIAWGCKLWPRKKCLEE